MSYILSTKYARKDDPDFIVAAARAFYVTSWADREEELGRGYSGQELTECAPETARWAFKLARELATRICLQEFNSINYNIFLPSLLAKWTKMNDAYAHKDRESTEDNFGFYAAMSAMGHGVNLHDMGIEFNVPYVSNDR